MNEDRFSKHIEFKDGLKAYKNYLSGDMIAKQNEAVIAALNALPVLDNDAEQKISASYVKRKERLLYLNLMRIGLVVA